MEHNFVKWLSLEDICKIPLTPSGNPLGGLLPTVIATKGNDLVIKIGFSLPEDAPAVFQDIVNFDKS